ncbi:MAG: hypothetical protein U0T83_06670 [Bacteriovoracaceae bacterium]
MKTMNLIMAATLVLSISCSKHESEKSETIKENQELASTTVVPTATPITISIVETPKPDEELLKRRKKDLEENIDKFKNNSIEFEKIGIVFNEKKLDLNYSLLNQLRHKEHSKLFITNLKISFENHKKQLDEILNDFIDVLDEATKNSLKDKFQFKTDIDTLISDITENTNGFVDFCNGESIDADSIAFAQDIFEKLKNTKYVSPKVNSCSDVLAWVNAGHAAIAFDEVDLKSRFHNPRLLIGLERLYGLEIQGDKKNLLNSKFVDLSILEKFPDLNWFKTTRFNFTMNEVSKPLTLKKVILIEGNFENPKFLKYFPYLEELNMFYSGVKTLEPILKLQYLKELELQHNLIEDLSPLVHMYNLKELRIQYNFVQNLMPLKNLKNLTSLDLTHNFVTDLSPIEDLENLNWLDVARSEIRICPQNSKSSGLRYICDMF